MREDFVNGDHNGRARPMSLDDHVIEEIGIPDNLGRPVDPQGVRPARDHGQDADIGVLQNVVETEDKLVSGPFRDGNGVVVQDVDESCRVPFGRGVHATLGVGGGHHAEGARGQPLAIEPAE